MFKWIVELNTGTTELIKSSNFPKYTTVIFILVWLVHILTKVQYFSMYLICIIIAKKMNIS